MKSTQISSMLISLTQTEEASLCGGSGLLISKGVYDGVKIFKGSPGKKGVKKQTVQSTTVQSTIKVVKATKDVKISNLGLLDNLFSLFDW